MSSEEDVDAAMEFQTSADEILHFAILHFFAINPDGNGFNKLLGMEMSLLRHASRMQLIMNKFGATNTKQQFVDLAGATYDDVAKYEPKKPRIKHKKPKITLVK